MSDVKFILALSTLFLLASCGRFNGLSANPPPTPPAPAPTSTAFPTPAPASPSANEFAVIGYFPDYRELNLEWGKYVTDIIYFSAEPVATGELDTSRLEENIFSQLHELQGLYGTRVLISVGGWERSGQFAAMTENPETRRKFVDRLAEYVHENKLNGVDFDWEFPQNEAEFQNYIRLLEEVKADFAPKGLIVSVALSPDSEFPLGEYAVVDRIHIMSYDRQPRHSTYAQAVWDLQKSIDAGIPREKLILGVPFYGRKTFAPFDGAAYADIVAQYHPAPDVDEVEDIFFNGMDTVQRKTCLAMKEHAAGVMIWELGQDTWNDTSLLRAIDAAVAAGCMP